MSDVVLAVRDLAVEVSGRERSARAVDGLTFALERGRTLGLLGESGCGKSMAALAIMNLLPAGARIVGGAAELVSGGVSTPAWKARGDRIAMIFQEPATALNPVLTVGEQIAEPLVTHRGSSRRQAQVRVESGLVEVGLRDAAAVARGYPHQLSGGMRQRVLIAMALACEPEVLIADEPTTALDVTLQAQILALLERLKRDRHMAVLLISHDFAVLRACADDVLVMYAGRPVEIGPCASVLGAPRHPYTQGLVASHPAGLPPKSRLPSIAGAVPVLGQAPSGCAFRDRCPRAAALCAERRPALAAGVACHFPGESRQESTA
jgi:peptide/nickel transport system ATP-binding protein